jgi:hypothetical protein
MGLGGVMALGSPAAAHAGVHLTSPTADDAVASFDGCPLPTARERGSSSGQGSPWAEQEVQAGSPQWGELDRPRHRLKLL